LLFAVVQALCAVFSAELALVPDNAADSAVAR
jgi:hypothetical protein